MSKTVRRKKRDNICPKCGKKCLDPQALRTHIKVHPSYKWHTCSLCGKRFPNSAVLNSHIRFQCSKLSAARFLLDGRFLAKHGAANALMKSLNKGTTISQRLQMLKNTSATHGVDDFFDDTQATDMESSESRSKSTSEDVNALKSAHVLHALGVPKDSCAENGTFAETSAPICNGAEDVCDDIDILETNEIQPSMLGDAELVERRSIGKSHNNEPVLADNSASQNSQRTDIAAGNSSEDIIDLTEDTDPAEDLEVVERPLMSNTGGSDNEEVSFVAEASPSSSGKDYDIQESLTLPLQIPGTHFTESRTQCQERGDLSSNTEAEAAIDDVINYSLEDDIHDSLYKIMASRRRKLRLHRNRSTRLLAQPVATDDTCKTNNLISRQPWTRLGKIVRRKTSKQNRDVGARKPKASAHAVNNLKVWTTFFFGKRSQKLATSAIADKITCKITKETFDRNVVDLPLCKEPSNCRSSEGQSCVITNRESQNSVQRFDSNSKKTKCKETPTTRQKGRLSTDESEPMLKPTSIQRTLHHHYRMEHLLHDVEESGIRGAEKAQDMANLVNCSSKADTSTSDRDLSSDESRLIRNMSQVESHKTTFDGRQVNSKSVDRIAINSKRHNKRSLARRSCSNEVALLLGTTAPLGASDQRGKRSKSRQIENDVDNMVDVCNSLQTIADANQSSDCNLLIDKTSSGHNLSVEKTCTNNGHSDTQVFNLGDEGADTRRKKSRRKRHQCLNDVEPVCNIASAQHGTFQTCSNKNQCSESKKYRLAKECATTSLLKQNSDKKDKSKCLKCGRAPKEKRQMQRNVIRRRHKPSVYANGEQPNLRHLNRNIRRTSKGIQKRDVSGVTVRGLSEKCSQCDEDGLEIGISLEERVKMRRGGIHDLTDALKSNVGKQQEQRLKKSSLDGNSQRSGPQEEDKTVVPSNEPRLLAGSLGRNYCVQVKLKRLDLDLEGVPNLKALYALIKTDGSFSGKLMKGSRKMGVHQVAELPEDQNSLQLELKSSTDPGLEKSPFQENPRGSSHQKTNAKLMEQCVCCNGDDLEPTSRKFDGKPCEIVETCNNQLELPESDDGIQPKGKHLKLPAERSISQETGGKSRKRRFECKEDAPEVEISLKKRVKTRNNEIRSTQLFGNNDRTLAKLGCLNLKSGRKSVSQRMARKSLKQCSQCNEDEKHGATLKGRGKARRKAIQLAKPLRNSSVVQDAETGITSKTGVKMRRNVNRELAKLPDSNVGIRLKESLFQAGGKASTAQKIDEKPRESCMERNRTLNHGIASEGVKTRQNPRHQSLNAKLSHPSVNVNDFPPKEDTEGSVSRKVNAKSLKKLSGCNEDRLESWIASKQRVKLLRSKLRLSKSPDVDGNQAKLSNLNRKVQEFSLLKSKRGSSYQKRGENVSEHSECNGGQRYDTTLEERVKKHKSMTPQHSPGDSKTKLDFSLQEGRQGSVPQRDGTPHGGKRPKSNHASENTGSNLRFSGTIRSARNSNKLFSDRHKKKNHSTSNAVSESSQQRDEVHKPSERVAETQIRENVPETKNSPKRVKHCRLTQKRDASSSKGKDHKIEGRTIKKRMRRNLSSKQDSRQLALVRRSGLQYKQHTHFPCNSRPKTQCPDRCARRSPRSRHEKRVKLGTHPSCRNTTHSVVRPYKCVACNIGYTRKSSLKRHNVARHNKWL